MADARINALTEATSLDDGDWLVAEVGDSEARKVSLETLGESLPGFEIAYVEGTSNVTVASATAATPTDVISSGAVTYDGTRICVEFFIAVVELTATTDFISFTLWDDSTRLGDIGSLADINSASIQVLARRYLTPSAGSHTYKIAAFRGAANGTLYAGAGTSGTYMPMYIRITKA